MDSLPLISVIIPMYNTRDYIEKTVQSVLAQTYKRLEIVIVDDGSTDNGAEIVQKLQKSDSRILYIRQENGGVSAARNNAIANSSGEYLAFLDSDDLWSAEKLEKQINRIQTTKMEACYCGYQYFCGSEMGKRYPERYFEGKILEEVIKEKVSVWTSTIVIKKSIASDNGISFRAGLNWSEDMDFFCRLMYKCSFCCVKENLALYRQRENSLSVSPNRAIEIKLWEDYLEWMKNEKSPVNYDSLRIEKAITEYKLPSIAIFCLYQMLISGERSGEDFFKQMPLHLIKAFKPSLSSTGIKLLMKKLLIRYRYNIKG